MMKNVQKPSDAEDKDTWKHVIREAKAHKTL
jgi:hypothetical protein